jgi:choice-of-anchor C domain-containing protein
MLKVKRTTFLGIVLMLCLACVGTVAAGGMDINLVSNGGFEDPVVSYPYSTIYAGNGLPGWIITTQSIDLMHAWTPHSGDQCIDLAGNGRGKISQTIKTEVGANYEISFWLSGNPHSRYQGPKGLNVYWAGEKVKSVTFDTTGKSGDNMGWTLVTISGLKAKATTTEIAFEQGETSDDHYGVVLDDISVIDPVTPAPEFPSTTLPAALLVGFMGIILFVQKSRKD